MDMVGTNSNQLRADPPPKGVEVHFASFRRRVDPNATNSKRDVG